jgi:hypothetical protein
MFEKCQLEVFTFLFPKKKKIYTKAFFERVKSVQKIRGQNLLAFISVASSAVQP